jgi:hypothetical protein
MHSIPQLHLIDNIIVSNVVTTVHGSRENYSSHVTSLLLVTREYPNLVQPVRYKSTNCWDAAHVAAGEYSAITILLHCHCTNIRLQYYLLLTLENTGNLLLRINTYISRSNLQSKIGATGLLTSQFSVVSHYDN